MYSLTQKMYSIIVFRSKIAIIILLDTCDSSDESMRDKSNILSVRVQSDINVKKI